VTQTNGQTDPAAVMARLGVLSSRRNRERPVTEAEAEELEKHDPCGHCGGYHARACPRVKRMEWAPNGAIVVAVEFWPWAEVDWTGVLFTDVTDDGDVAVDISDLDTLLTWAEHQGTEFKSDVGFAIRRLRLVLEEQRAVQSGGETP